tara:strand:- start:134 stop:370 length:237 start_codon:yes stop_codon:yes gene_type:complete
MMDIETINQIRNEISKMIDNKIEHIVHGVDSMEKLQYSRGQLSSLEELLQVIKYLLKNEDIEDDDFGKTRRVSDSFES